MYSIWKANKLLYVKNNQQCGGRTFLDRNQAVSLLKELLAANLVTPLLSQSGRMSMARLA
jgi:hypothetical protein